MNENNLTHTAADLEQAFSDASLGAQKMSRFNSPVCILIHSFRHRLGDPDGISAKAAIDGIVASGILADDTAKQIKEVRFKQTKIATSQDEKTEIIIEEAD